jgi:hypothetical protein
MKEKKRLFAIFQQKHSILNGSPIVQSTSMPIPLSLMVSRRAFPTHFAATPGSKTCPALFPRQTFGLDK